MRIDSDKLTQGLKQIGYRQEPKKEALHPQLRAGFVLASDIRLSGSQAIPDLEFAWSGFQLLELNLPIVKIFEQHGFGPWSMTGAGTVFLSARLFKELSNEYTFQKEDIPALTDFISALFKNCYEIHEPLVIQVTSDWQSTANQLGELGYGLSVALSSPCTEEEWNKLYQVHQLEVQAAEAVLRDMNTPLPKIEVSDMANGRNLH